MIKHVKYFYITHNKLLLLFKFCEKSLNMHDKHLRRQ